MSAAAIQCTYCEKTLPTECFAQKKDQINAYYKYCKTCTAKRKGQRDKRKCPHGRDILKCVDCGGQNICCHKKLIGHCVICGGHLLCVHDKMKSKCKECDIKTYMKKAVMGRMNSKIKDSKLEYLGCDINEFMSHLESQFKEDMNFNNYGSIWHLSYKLPIGVNGLEQDEIIRRFHYSNISPAYPYEKMRKKE